MDKTTYYLQKLIYSSIKSWFHDESYIWTAIKQVIHTHLKAFDTYEKKY